MTLRSLYLLGCNGHHCHLELQRHENAENEFNDDLMISFIVPRVYISADQSCSPHTEAQRPKERTGARDWREM